MAFTTPFTLVINTINVATAKIELPNRLLIPISCSKYAPNPAIIIKNVIKIKILIIVLITGFSANFF